MGGPRAGRSRMTEMNLSVGDQEMKVQRQEGRSDNCRAPELWAGLRCGFRCAFLGNFLLFGGELRTFRGELLLYGLAEFLYVHAMPLCRGDQYIRVAGWHPICAFQQNDLDQQF